MEQGGPMMWPILILSIIGFAFIIERYFALRKARINVNEFLAKIRRALMVNRSLRDAVKICEQYQGPVASIMKAGLLKFGQPREDVEKSIENAAMYELSRLERGLPVIATAANIEPLLGFLGTVTGMINSFDALAKQGLSNPGAVAAGISEALITTAAGLIIAIPMQLAYNFYTGKVNRFVRDIETATNMLLETFGEMDRGGISPDRGESAPAPAKA
jgi:biopolymer transport protein ExbB